METSNDHDLLIRMDAKLDIFIRQQEMQAAAIKNLSERFEDERNKVWNEIGLLKDVNLSNESFNKGRNWVFAMTGMVVGAIPFSLLIAIITLVL